MNALQVERLERPAIVTAAAPARVVVVAQGPAWQAFLILHWAFVVLPLTVGADKFFDVLVNWDAYLAPIVPQTLGISAHSFMMIVGVIEIATGLLVAIWLQIGAYVVAFWLWGIIINLMLVPGFYDIALRDFGLLLAALTLARLAAAVGARGLPRRG